MEKEHKSSAFFFLIDAVESLLHASISRNLIEININITIGYHMMKSKSILKLKLLNHI